MSKKCSFCSAEIRLFSKHVKLSDGFVCKGCLKQLGLDDIPDSKKHSVSEIVNEIQDREEIAQQINTTEIVAGRICIDREHKLFALDGTVFHFEEFKSMEYSHESNGREMGNTNVATGIGSSVGFYALSRPRIDNKGKVKRNVVGGIAGAAIGGAIGNSIDKRISKSNDNVTHSFEIRVYLNCLLNRWRILEFEADSSNYEEVKIEVNQCMNALREIDCLNKYGTSKPSFFQRIKRQLTN